MPNARSLRKVTKQAKIKKGSLHPNGRKAKMLAKSTLREEKVNRTKLQHALRKNDQLQIVNYMQESINRFPDQETFSLDEERAFVDEFIRRGDEELDQLKHERRPGRPATKRQDQLQMNRDREYAVFKSGWKLPDLRVPQNVKRLRSWKGDSGTLTAIDFVDVKSV